MKVIEAKNIHFNYRDVKVLNGINFSIDEGDFIGVIGQNGTGKSTLFKVIAGLIHPSHGSISVFGEDISKINKDTEISYISQKASSAYSGFPATSLEVVLSGLTGKIGLFRSFNKFHKNKAMEALRAVGIEALKDKLISELSGGQFQRVLIAKALVNDPKLLLLDEPTVGIDNQSVEYICCLLAQLNKEKKISIAMITHDLPGILAHANKLYIFENDGKAHMIDNTNDIDTYIHKHSHGITGGNK